MISTRLIQWTGGALLSLVLLACGGGGGDPAPADNNTPGTTDTGPSLSVSSAVPGEVITVSDATIKADAVVDVVFSQGATAAALDEGHAVTVKAIATADGAVDVAVPPYLNFSNGEFGAGPVTVSVQGRTASTALQVQAFLELGFDTGGQVMIGALEYAVEQYELALVRLDALALEVPGVTEIGARRSRIQSEITRLEAMVDEIEFNGTLTVAVDGATVVLSPAQLSQLDVWILHELVSAQIVLDAAAPAAAARGVVPRGVRQTISPAWEEAKARWAGSDAPSETTKRSIQDVFSTSMKDVLKWGKQSLNGGLAMLSLFFSGVATVTSGGTAVMANAAGVGVAQLSALLSAFQAWVSGENTDAALQRDRGRFDVTAELLSATARVGSQYVSAYGAGKLAAAGTAVNMALSGKDLASAAEFSLCEKLGSPAPFCAGGDSSAPRPATDLDVLRYVNFDGSRGELAVAADIRISDNPRRPLFSWSGQATILLVTKVDAAGTIVYGIQSEDGAPPLGSPVRYGDYSLSGITTLGSDPSPDLAAGQSYTVQVMRDDGEQALVFFSVN
ncbi:MAG TPA: hypothetical protein ENJ19_06430 [Gammaproteobacteria bacterium]|nr:hypothetical protein [Gammaproteobacteria bacterium]